MLILIHFCVASLASAHTSIMTTIITFVCVWWKQLRPSLLATLKFINTVLLPITHWIFWKWQKQKNQIKSIHLDNSGPLCASGLFRGWECQGSLCRFFMPQTRALWFVFPESEKEEQGEYTLSKRIPYLPGRVRGWLRSAIKPWRRLGACLLRSVSAYIFPIQQSNLPVLDSPRSAFP